MRYFLCLVLLGFIAEAEFAKEARNVPLYGANKMLDTLLHKRRQVKDYSLEKRLLGLSAVSKVTDNIPILGSTLDGVDKVLDSALGPIAPVLEAPLKGVNMVLDTVLDPLAPVLDPTLGTVGTVLSPVLEPTLGILETPLDAVATGVDAGLSPLHAVLDKPTDLLKGVLDASLNPLVDALGIPLSGTNMLLNTVLNPVTSLLETPLRLAHLLVSTLFGDFPLLEQVVTELARLITDVFSFLPGNWEERLADLLPSFRKRALEDFPLLEETMKELDSLAKTNFAEASRVEKRAMLDDYPVIQSFVEEAKSAGLMVAMSELENFMEGLGIDVTKRDDDDKENGDEGEKGFLGSIKDAFGNLNPFVPDKDENENGDEDKEAEDRKKRSAVLMADRFIKKYPTLTQLAVEIVRFIKGFSGVSGILGNVPVIGNLFDNPVGNAIGKLPILG